MSLLRSLIASLNLFSSSVFPMFLLAWVGVVGVVKVKVGVVERVEN